MRYTFLLFLSFILFNPVKAQPSEAKYPTNEFRYPLNLPPVIAGSFGELRGNHFHSGLDFKTNQRTGYPVYAAADGYVSRLRVQSTGFGNAVYITHLNGFTTVYGHLERFNQSIALTVKNYQYRQESFDVDFPLPAIEMQVKKGDIIGWSGNSGSSGGPHLHFEIRDTQTEETINPQLFGLTIPDRVKPIINGLYIYNLQSDELFSENTSRKFFGVSGSAGNYLLNQVIPVSTEVGFGLLTVDRNSASANPVGVYSIELLADGKPIYSVRWERFFFDHSRAINSHIDYPVFINTGRRIQKSFIEPGNPLTIYNKDYRNGRLQLTDNKVHEMQYIIKDIAGNSSTLRFKVQMKEDLPLMPANKNTVLFRHNEKNFLEKEDFKVEIDPGVLYSDLNFNYNATTKPAGGYSKMHQVHSRLIPVQKAYKIWIRPDETLAPELRTKALIVDSKRISQGGSFENGFIKAEPKSLGNFYVTVDTVAPRIIPINISEGKNLQTVSKIVFKISDNLSGIRSFTGRLNGRWILMQFDAKTSTLWHNFEEPVSGKSQNLQLLVTDMKMNTSTYQVNFNR